MDTPWETRNLGIPAYKLIAKSLREANFRMKLAEGIALLRKQHENHFVFARIAKEDLEFVGYLEAQGFRFVEGTLEPYSKLKSNRAYKCFCREKNLFVPPNISIEELHLCALRQVNDKIEEASKLREIAQGAFSDDRFHIDDYCSQKIADQRFAYWVDDLATSEECVFEVLKVEGSIVGFIARKENNFVLAAFRPEHVALGSFLWLSVCQALEREGFNEVYSTISTNNIPVLNLYIKLGFRFRNIMYSFHLWGASPSTQ